MEDYTETFESKVQDIRLDGPDINTSILENIDNSIGWAKANHIEINFNKHDETLTIKDNGENGFGSKDALKRFFKLGKANKGVTTGTIGKYGKGGYKSIINISRRVDITSYFNDKKYVIGTNFTEMIETNSYTPNIKLTITDNEENMKGSIIKLNIRAEYVDKFNTETLIRFIKRAYHNFNINFIVNDIEFNTSECKLYDEVLKSKKFIISYDINKHIFCCDCNSTKENENKIIIGELEYYVLRNMLTKIDLLGNSPGIDFYRNNRLCNAKNPIRNIGEISRYLDMGQMRGMRCHMAFRYNNVKLTDTNDVDSSLGLNTTKEICEDENKFNKSLRELLENKSKECSNAYEKFTSDKKEGLEKYLLREKTFFSKMEDNDLLTYDIDGALKNYKYFQDIKTWYLDENMEYKFYDNKKIATEAKTNGDATLVRKNSEIIVKYVNPIVQKLESLIKKKTILVIKNKAKESYKAEYGFSDEKSEEYFNNHIYLESLKREIINLEENKSYEEAMSKCDEIIKIATESEFKTYFEEYLDYAIDKLNTIRIDKDNLEKITDIKSILDEYWDKAIELFNSEDYEESKNYFNKVIEFVNGLDGDISEDILEYKTDSISEISKIDGILEKRVKLETSIETINSLIKGAEQIDKKEIGEIKKGYEKVIEFIDSKDNIDIKGDLKTYKIIVENKIKSLKPKKVKKQKYDIDKYLTLNHNDITADEWESIKSIMISQNH